MQKLTIWYKGKDVTRMRLTRSLDSLSSSQIRVYPPPMLQPDRPNHKYIIKELMCTPV
jgi:hypothetical protein